MMLTRQILKRIGHVPITLVTTLFAMSVLVPILSGCGGGTEGNAVYNIFPSPITGATRAEAGGTLNFSALIQNAPFASPRYFVELPMDEGLYDARLPITDSNVDRGSIDPTTGIYTAPIRLRPVTRNDKGEATVQTRVTVDVTDTQTVQDIKDYLLGRAIDYGDRLAQSPQDLRDSLIKEWRASVQGDETYPLNSTAALQDMESFAQSYALNTKGTETNTPDALQDALQTRLIRRLVTQLSDETKNGNKRRKAIVAFPVFHRIVADPAKIDVSIRTTYRLADHVRVLGDQDGTVASIIPDMPNNPNVTTPQPETTSTAGEYYTTSGGKPLVTWSIKDGQLGAGGSVDPNTGVYTAPLTLPDQARNNATDAVSVRRRKDIIVATSVADNTITAEVEITVVTGDAGSNIEVK